MKNIILKNKTDNRVLRTNDIPVRAKELINRSATSLSMTQKQVDKIIERTVKIAQKQQLKEIQEMLEKQTNMYIGFTMPEDFAWEDAVRGFSNGIYRELMKLMPKRHS